MLNPNFQQNINFNLPFDKTTQFISIPTELPTFYETKMKFMCNIGEDKSCMGDRHIALLWGWLPVSTRKAHLHIKTAISTFPDK